MAGKVKEPAEVSLTIPLDSGFTHILFNLAAQGYSYVCLEYSGGGDSGCIDSTYLIKRGFATEKKDGSVTVHNNAEHFHMSDELVERIEEEAHSQVLESASDWWNNDGGGGTLYISTDDCTYHGDHYINVTVQEEEALDGKMHD